MSGVSAYTVLSSNDNLLALDVPARQLKSGSLIVTAPGKKFSQWTVENHIDSYTMLQQVIGLWNKTNFTDQYSILGKMDSSDFKWEIIPYQKCRTIFGRIIQQLQVLWRVVFGGFHVDEISLK